MTFLLITLKCFESQTFRQRRRGVDPGGGGGSQWKYWGGGGGQTFISFCPPIISTTWKIHNNVMQLARILLKSTVRHYTIIKFNIKILLNIQHFQFCGALQAQSFILRLCGARRKIWNFPYFPPPPPPPNPKNGSTPLTGRPGIYIHICIAPIITTIYHLFRLYRLTSFTDHICW